MMLCLIYRNYYYASSMIPQKKILLDNVDLRVNFYFDIENLFNLVLQI